MKTKITTTAFLAGLFTVISTLGVFATAPGSIEKATRENVRREIVRNITCPDFVTENTEANDVKAVVSVDENGKVTLHEVNSANPQLKNYVVNVLKEMRVKSPTATEKFVLVVKFRTA